MASGLPTVADKPIRCTSLPQKRERRSISDERCPLMPEVPICTSVGQEGIDLHRYCRHVVHYDLAWNPAVMEQRTGRTDRIGCKALRERKSLMSEDIFLEIGVPFLAGTYDERMYEQLRLRAQTFEVLTGGDMAAENAEGNDLDEGHGDESMERGQTPLPDGLTRDLSGPAARVGSQRCTAFGAELSRGIEKDRASVDHCAVLLRRRRTSRQERKEYVTGSREADQVGVARGKLTSPLERHELVRDGDRAVRPLLLENTEPVLDVITGDNRRELLILLVVDGHAEAAALAERKLE